jgi:hypothetical protein
MCASSENYIRTIARYIDHVVIHWQPLFSLRFLARREISPVYRPCPPSYSGRRRSFGFRPAIIFSAATKFHLTQCTATRRRHACAPRHRCRGDIDRRNHTFRGNIGDTSAVASSASPRIAALPGRQVSPEIKKGNRPRGEEVKPFAEPFP